mgnify:CR=1 FL=1
MEYKIQYSKIKNIYIQIKEGKVIVKAPKRVTREEIEKILKNKEKWINKNYKCSNQSLTYQAQ